MRRSTQYEKEFNNKTPDHLLMDKIYCKQKMKTRVGKAYEKDGKNLYHGKVTKTGNYSTFSEKKIRRTWKINLFLKTFWSEVLSRNFHFYVSSKAFKCMRKYGGFDNYILLTKPQKMKSKFGEYLRQCMYRKMMDSNFKVHHFINEGDHKKKGIGRKSQLTRTFESRPGMQYGMWFPKEIRHKDLSKYHFRDDHELPKKDLEWIAKVKKMQENNEDVTLDHPMMADLKKEYVHHKALLEEQVKIHNEKYGKIEDYFDNNKKLLTLYEAQVKEAERAMDQQGQASFDNK